MEIQISTPALLFPAISLLLLAYTNRFLALATVVRNLTRSTVDTEPHEAENTWHQIQNLQRRIGLIKWMQAVAILSFSLCVVSMICLFINAEGWGRVTFGVSLALILLSLVISFAETLQSGEALRYELERCGRRSGGLKGRQ